MRLFCLEYLKLNLTKVVRRKWCECLQVEKVFERSMYVAFVAGELRAKLGRRQQCGKTRKERRSANTNARARQKRDGC